MLLIGVLRALAEWHPPALILKCVWLDIQVGSEDEDGVVPLKSSITIGLQISRLEASWLLQYEETVPGKWLETVTGIEEVEGLVNCDAMVDTVCGPGLGFCCPCSVSSERTVSGLGEDACSEFWGSVHCRRASDDEYWVAYRVAQHSPELVGTLRMLVDFEEGVSIDLSTTPGQEAEVVHDGESVELWWLNTGGLEHARPIGGARLLRRPLAGEEDGEEAEWVLEEEDSDCDSLNEWMQSGCAASAGTCLGREPGEMEPLGEGWLRHSSPSSTTETLLDKDVYVDVSIAFMMNEERAVQVYGVPRAVLRELSVDDDRNVVATLSTIFHSGAVRISLVCDEATEATVSEKWVWLEQHAVVDVILGTAVLVEANTVELLCSVRAGYADGSEAILGELQFTLDGLEDKLDLSGSNGEEEDVGDVVILEWASGNEGCGDCGVVDVACLVGGLCVQRMAERAVAIIAGLGCVLLVGKVAKGVLTAMKKGNSKEVVVVVGPGASPPSSCSHSEPETPHKDTGLVEGVDESLDVSEVGSPCTPAAEESDTMTATLMITEPPSPLMMAVAVELWPDHKSELSSSSCSGDDEEVWESADDGEEN